MKRIICIVLALALLGGLSLGLIGCNEASRVSQNIRTAADNFGVYRRLVAVNTITDELLFEVLGVFSFEVLAGGDRVRITVRVGEGEYRLHTIATPPTVFWSVEDLHNDVTLNNRYVVNFRPDMLWPWALDTDPTHDFDEVMARTRSNQPNAEASVDEALASTQD